MVIDADNDSQATETEADADIDNQAKETDGNADNDSQAIETNPDATETDRDSQATTETEDQQQQEQQQQRAGESDDDDDEDDDLPLFLLAATTMRMAAQSQKTPSQEPQKPQSHEPQSPQSHEPQSPQSQEPQTMIEVCIPPLKRTAAPIKKRTVEPTKKRVRFRNVASESEQEEEEEEEDEDEEDEEEDMAKDDDDGDEDNEVEEELAYSGELEEELVYIEELEDNEAEEAEEALADIEELKENEVEEALADIEELEDKIGKTRRHSRRIRNSNKSNDKDKSSSSKSSDNGNDACDSGHEDEAISTSEDQPRPSIKYRVSRLTKTVQDVYQEWTQGLDGHLPINSLEILYHKFWRDLRDRSFFRGRQAIMKEIYRIMDDDHLTALQAIERMENERAGKALSTYSDRIFRRNAERARQQRLTGADSMTAKELRAMAKDIVAVQDVWKEFIEGINGGEPLLGLKESQIEDADRPKFRLHRMIVREVQRLITEDAKTLEEAIATVEALRRSCSTWTLIPKMYKVRDEDRRRLKLEALEATEGRHIYRLNQELATVRGIWREWNGGLNGNLSIRDLNNFYNASWRVPKDDSQYQARRCIVAEVKRLILEDQKTEEEALDFMEEELEKTRFFESLATRIRKRKRRVKAGAAAMDLSSSTTASAPAAVSSTGTTASSSSSNAVVGAGDEDDDNDVPFFEMDKSLRSVKDIFQEWNYGTNGSPSINQMTEWYQFRWRHPKDLSRYKLAHALVREVWRVMREEDITEEEAIRALEEQRGGLGLDRFMRKIRAVKNGVWEAPTVVIQKEEQEGKIKVRKARKANAKAGYGRKRKRVEEEEEEEDEEEEDKEEEEEEDEEDEDEEEEEDEEEQEGKIKVRKARKAKAKARASAGYGRKRMRAEEEEEDEEEEELEE